MKTVYSEDHNLHCGLLDPRGGETWRESAECPARANNVAQAVREAGIGAVIVPQPFDEAKYMRLRGLP